MPIALFSAKRIPWGDAYEKMTVSFGISQGKYSPESLRLHNDLRKRQLVPTGFISYPSATVSPTGSATSVVKNLQHQVTPGKNIITISNP